MGQCQHREGELGAHAGQHDAADGHAGGSDGADYRDGANHAGLKAIQNSLEAHPRFFLQSAGDDGSQNGQRCGACHRELEERQTYDEDDQWNQQVPALLQDLFHGVHVAGIHTQQAALGRLKVHHQQDAQVVQNGGEQGAQGNLTVLVAD